MPDIKSAHIIFHLTNDCPNKCIHCYNCSGKRSEFELSFQEIQSLHKTLRDRYEKIVLILSGGEPTLRDDLRDIITLFGEDKKFSLSIFSQSARLIEYKDLLKKYRIGNNITISGMEETHNMIMGRSDAWADAMKLIEEFHYSVRIFVHKRNLQEAQEIAKLLKDFDYKRVEVAMPVKCGRGANMELPTNEEFWEFIKILQSSGLKVKKEKITVQKALNAKLNIFLAMLFRLFAKRLLSDYVIDARGILNNRKMGYCLLQYASQFVDVLDISSTGDVSSSCCFAVDNPLFYAGNILVDDWEKIRSFKPKFNYHLIREKFGNKVMSHTMDGCTLCIQCWPGENFVIK